MSWFNSTFATWVSSRHLLKRQLRHQLWQARGIAFAETKLEDTKSFTHPWSAHSCPVINHPSQQHLLASKMANMKKAAVILDGVMLRPQEVLSFWRWIRKPTAERGFTTGGGLCQISGLLYKLALEAGLKIVERYPHSIDGYGERRYLPLGQDATVAWLSKDLVFKNSTRHDLVVKIQAFEDRAEGKIIATAPKPYRVELTQSQKLKGALHHVRTERHLYYGKAYFYEDLGADEYQPPSR